MKKLNLQIQSVSDIITNSSTEVFMIYSKDSLQQIKSLVNAILSLADCKETFDDLFIIKPKIETEELFNSHPEYKNLSSEELHEQALKYDAWKRWDNPWPTVYGYEVIAKDIKNDNVAAKLSNIDEIFGTYGQYC